MQVAVKYCSFERFRNLSNIVKMVHITTFVIKKRKGINLLKISPGNRDFTLKNSEY